MNGAQSGLQRSPHLPATDTSELSPLTFDASDSVRPKSSADEEQPSRQPSNFSANTLKWGSLALLVLQNSGVFVAMRYTRLPDHRGRLYLTSVVVLVVELSKMVICLLLFAYQQENKSLSHYTGALYEQVRAECPTPGRRLLCIVEGGTLRYSCDLTDGARCGRVRTQIWVQRAETLRLGIPATCYAVQNNLLFVAVSNLSAAAAQVCRRSSRRPSGGWVGASSCQISQPRADLTAFEQISQPRSRCLEARRGAEQYTHLSDETPPHPILPGTLPNEDAFHRSLHRRVARPLLPAYPVALFLCEWTSLQPKASLGPRLSGTRAAHQRHTSGTRAVTRSR